MSLNMFDRVGNILTDPDAITQTTANDSTSGSTDSILTAVDSATGLDSASAIIINNNFAELAVWLNAAKADILSMHTQVTDMVGKLNKANGGTE